MPFRLAQVLRETLMLEAPDERLHLVALEDDVRMVALQQALRKRTGAGTVPRIFFGGSAYPRPPIWVGGAEDLEAMAANGPGPLAARLMEAVDDWERMELANRQQAEREAMWAQEQ